MSQRNSCSHSQGWLTHSPADEGDGPIVAQVDEDGGAAVVGGADGAVAEGPVALLVAGAVPGLVAPQLRERLPGRQVTRAVEAVYAVA